MRIVVNGSPNAEGITVKWLRGSEGIAQNSVRREGRNSLKIVI